MESKIRTTPPCVFVSMSVIPFTVRLNDFCGEEITRSDLPEEMLPAFDEDENFADDKDSALLDELFSVDEDFASLEDDSFFAEELLGAEPDDSSFDELEEITELLLAGICDELDSADDDKTEEEDSSLELLDCGSLDSPYLE